MLRSLFLFLLCSAGLAVGSTDARPWMADPTVPPEDRAKLLLAHMNVTEKLHLLAGNGTMKPYVGAVTGNARLGIPPLNLNDGPQGFRSNDYPGTTYAAQPAGRQIGKGRIVRK